MMDPAGRRAMRLEIRAVRIRDVQVGARTELRDHVAVIDPDELRALALQDSQFPDVRVRVAQPDQLLRIIKAIHAHHPPGREYVKRYHARRLEAAGCRLSNHPQAMKTAPRHDGASEAREQ